MTKIIVWKIEVGGLWKLTRHHSGWCQLLKIYSKSLIGKHYSDFIMTVMTSQITSLTIVYSTFYSGADQRKHQSSTSLAFVSGIHRWPGEFLTQRASNAENVSIWWRHHGNLKRKNKFSMVPSASLAPLGVWLCAGTIVAKLQSYIYIYGKYNRDGLNY